MTNTETMETAKEGSPLNLHVANIMSFEYSPISSMALNDAKTKLALFRGGDNPAIEIWDMTHIPFVEKILYDLETINDKVSVEGLVWVRDRLFSCGLHGFIVEHDLCTRKMKKKYMATSGPVWNLSVNPERTLLGAATEDGFVNIFEVVDDELLFQKVLDRQEGRILCLCWSPCGKYIATGSVDNVRVWDVERRHAVQRLSLGRSKKNETIVWSVLIIDELTVVSGDSRGVVSFWDGRLGVLMFKIVTHRADILCMSLAPDNSTIYVSGVDPTVVLLTRAGKDGEKWVRSHQRIMHTNDVLCLATIGNKLISGGVDCELTISIPPMRHTPKTVRKYPPVPKPPRVTLSRESNRVLVQESRGLSIWQLPSQDKDIVKLIDFKSRGEQIIESTCISPSGKVFVYSAASKISCFRLVECADGKIIPVKLRKVASSIEKKRDDFGIDLDKLSWNLNFLSECHVCSVSQDGSILQVIEVSENSDSYAVKPEILMEDYIDQSGINLVAASRNGRYLAVNTAAGLTYVIELSPQWTVNECAVLPTHDCLVSTLEFHPTQPYLLLTYVDHTARVYNFETGEVIFHEEIGGPKLKSEEMHRRKRPKKKQIIENTDRDLEEDEQKVTPKKPLGECHQPVLETSWSLDGTKLVFQEVNRLHMLEVTKTHINEHGSHDDIPSTKKSKRDKSSRGTSASPVPSGKSEEWTSDKTLLASRLEALSLKQRPDINGKVLVNWKTLDCEKVYKYVACTKFLHENSELLLVEMKPSSLLSKLPPAFARKRFGI